MSERKQAKRLRRRGRQLLDRAKLWFALARHGVRKPFTVIEEAKREDVPLHYALALLEKETGIPQRNVFGCDHGAGRAFCHQRVTRRRVQALLDSGLSNGIGWTQLTFRGFVIQADQAGGAHKPRCQCRIGFRLLRNLRDAHGGWRLAYQHFNGSGPLAVTYGYAAIGLAEKWKKRTKGLNA